MEIYCMVTETGLVPMYEDDYDNRKRLRVGDTVLCKISRPRNYRFHKKFFALVRLAFDNLPERIVQMLNIRSEDDMLTNIKLDLGLYSSVWHGGKEILKLGSISFEAMDNTEFETFYNRAVDLVLYRYLRGTDREELIEEIEQQFR